MKRKVENASIKDIPLDCPTKPCVGCGFCCKKSPCILSLKIYGKVDVCPALIWDETNHRYWCKACQIAGKLGAKYRAELYIGEGCCCGLNSDRQNIPPPAKAVTNVLSHEIQVLLSAIAKEWISGDVLYLILLRCKKELGEDWAKAAAHLIDQQRSTMTENFMG